MFYSWVHTGSIVDSYSNADSFLTIAKMMEVNTFANFHMVQPLKNRVLELYFMQLVRSGRLILHIRLTCTIVPLNTHHYEISI